jgi:hypothetical protein
MLRDGEVVDVYLADLQRLVSLMGQSDAEPLLKCAFMSGLPTNVADQLKSISAVETMELTALVSRARMMLSTGNDSNAAMCAVGQRKVNTRSHNSSGFHVPKHSRPKRREFQPEIRCYHCEELGHIKRYCPQLQGNASGAAFAPGAPST